MHASLRGTWGGDRRPGPVPSRNTRTVTVESHRSPASDFAQRVGHALPCHGTGSGDDRGDCRRDSPLLMEVEALPWMSPRVTAALRARVVGNGSTDGLPGWPATSGEPSRSRDPPRLRRRLSSGLAAVRNVPGGCRRVDAGDRLAHGSVPPHAAHLQHAAGPRQGCCIWSIGMLGLAAPTASRFPLCDQAMQVCAAASPFAAGAVRPAKFLAGLGLGGAEGDRRLAGNG